MSCKVEEEGHKIEGEGGAGWRWGATCLASLGGTCSWIGADWFSSCVVQNLSKKKNLSGINPTGL
jgi:hypothetical protein